MILTTTRMMLCMFAILGTPMRVSLVYTKMMEWNGMTTYKMPLVYTRTTQSMHSRNASSANRNNAENYFKMPLVSTRAMTCMFGLTTNSSGLLAS